MSACLTILGFNSAIPTVDGTPTAQLLEMGGHMILIDCGEGTQVQLRRAKAKFARINHIFISHLHGDHCFGLPGLVASFRLLGRENPLHIYGPVGIEAMLETVFKLTETIRSFEVIYHELSGTTSTQIFEDNKITVRTIPLNHRIYCNGYLFREQPHERHLNIEEIRKYPEIGVDRYPEIKAGKDICLSDGYVVKNSRLTREPQPSKAYAFCSDTRFLPSIVPIIQGVDLLYHEATFLHDLKEMADYTGHTTALEAGQIARMANVKKMVIGHFSNRYADRTVLQREAQQEFPETYLPVQLEKIVF